MTERPLHSLTPRARWRRYARFFAFFARTIDSASRFEERGEIPAEDTARLRECLHQILEGVIQRELGPLRTRRNGDDGGRSS